MLWPVSRPCHPFDRRSPVVLGDLRSGPKGTPCHGQETMPQRSAGGEGIELGFLSFRFPIAAEGLAVAFAFNFPLDRVAAHLTVAEYLIIFRLIH